MTSTYEVEHENGTSTIEGVHAFWFPAGHLVFLNEEGNAFAGFAEGTWHSFKKVEVEVEVEATPYPVGTWVSSKTFSDTFGPVVKVEGTRLTIRPVAGEAKGTNYTLPVQDVTDVLTREQVFALPVGTRVKYVRDLAEYARDLAEFQVVDGGVAWVTYSGGDPRPVEYQHPDDLECITTDITEFKVIA